jgi:polyisoprenoid-binding protein YceI
MTLQSRAESQERNPFITPNAESAAKDPDSSRESSVDSTGVAAELNDVDSVVYRLVPASHLQVKTGKAGLFGFAGHEHLIEARAFSGTVVFFPKKPASSHVEITVPTDSLRVLSPPDTAEIRKVTAAMRADVLHTSQYPEIRLISKQVTPTSDGLKMIGALTLTGQTREIPLLIKFQAGPDTLKASTSFSVKQTDFGIKPYSGGPAGTVKVADKVTFNIKAVAVRQGSASARASR